MAACLRYDVVMATRNRPEAVALSVPLIIAQTRPPGRIVIVDSSDDGAPIADIAARAAAAGLVEVVYLRADPGSAAQRNIGIAHCTADAIIFPDDDSLLYPDAAEAIMAVYEADTARGIAAVCATPADRPPPEAREKLGAYAADDAGPLRRTLRLLRQRAKEAVEFTNPFLAVGNRLGARHAGVLTPAVAEIAAPVPYMTGFRMSFRRDVIAEVRFDEALRRYAWFEDIDASWGAMALGGVVVARQARIYHHRVAGPRADGHRMGLWAILNRGYVVMKHVRANPDLFDAPAREVFRLKSYCRARAVAYRLLARDAYGRDRARGARDGLRLLGALTAAPAATLRQTYTDLERAEETAQSADD